jgi:hypothetical protein
MNQPAPTYPSAPPEVVKWILEQKDKLFRPKPA